MTVQGFLISSDKLEGTANQRIKNALPSGVLAEQVHPVTGKPISVSPLTWSHATFVALTQHILHRLAEMKICPECGLSLLDRPRGGDWIKQLYGQTCDVIHGLCKMG